MYVFDLLGNKAERWNIDGFWMHPACLHTQLHIEYLINYMKGTFIENKDFEAATNNNDKKETLIAIFFIFKVCWPTIKNQTICPI